MKRKLSVLVAVILLSAVLVPQTLGLTVKGTASLPAVLDAQTRSSTANGDWKVFLPVVMSSQSQSSVVNDGSFESGALAQWAAANATVSTDAAHSGRYGVILNGSGAWVSQNIVSRLAPNVTYNFSVWVRITKRTTSWGSAWFRLDKYSDCGTGAYGTVKAANDKTRGWQKLTLRRSFTASQLSTPVYVCLAGFGFANGIAHGDDIGVIITVVGTPTSNPPTATPTQTGTPNTATSTPTRTPTGMPTQTRTPAGTTTPVPTTSIPPSGLAEWSQFGANAQRTSYVPQDITNWAYRCVWNGQDASTHINTLGVEPVAGDGKIFISAGTSGVYAISDSNCAQVWNAAIASNSTVAYDNGYVYIVATNGTLYKLNSSTGATVASTSGGSGSTNPLPPLVLSDRVIFPAGNVLYAVTKSNLQTIWQYNAGARIDTPASYSANRNAVVIVTQDLYVHAISNTSGAQVWRTKPTPRTGGTITGSSDLTHAEVAEGYPAIADTHGILFVRYKIDWDSIYFAGLWQPSNTWIRDTLTANPARQNIFALSLNDGSQAFIVNIGQGGHEQNSIYIDQGRSPVIRVLPNGQEVAYAMCRGGTQYDARWDSHFCEIVLDNNTVAGYQAGDVRYIAYNHPPGTTGAAQYLITDEQPYVVGAGVTLMGAHWQAGQSVRMTNRSDAFGSFANPIQSQNAPTIVEREFPPAYAACTRNDATHSCGAGQLFYSEPNYGSGRLYSSGFWVYWGETMPNGGTGAFIATKNLVIYKAFSGAVFVLAGQTTGVAPTATPAASTPTAMPATRTPTPTNTPVASTPTPTTAPGGTTVVTNLSAPSSTGRYQKLEVVMQLSRAFPADSLLPYYFYDPADAHLGSNGISVDTVFIAPDGSTQTAPAFYYQDYVRTGTSQETMTPSSNYSWRVRFAPSQLGQYQYHVIVRDVGGTSRYPASGELVFNSIVSGSKGFVRVDPGDSRFMAFDDGSSFVPIASGRQWWKCCGIRSLDYDAAFNSFGQNGANLTRVWIQNDGYGLTVEGHFDAYTYPDDYNPVDRGIDIGALTKGTLINQRGARELDYILESAEVNGVYLELCSHSDPYWIWPYTLDGEAGSQQVGSDDPKHLAEWKRNFRYLVARWGYSTSVLSWENWNELAHILPNTPEWNFYSAYSLYQRASDPYHHLLTTSQGSQAYSPAFWSSGFFDIANYHDYMMPSRYPAALTNDEANFVSKFSWCLGTNGQLCSGLGVGDGTIWTGANKPWIWGEIDVGTSNWNEVNPRAQSGDARLRFLHNSTWAGLFSPLATSPIDWYWDQEDAATTSARLADRKRTQQFFSGITFDGMTFMLTAADAPSGYAGEVVTATNSNARVYAMKNAQGVVAWVQHRDYTWYNSPAVPAAISVTVTFPNVNGTFTVQLYDPQTGNTQNLGTVTANGTLVVNVGDVSKDMAIKARPVAASASEY